MDEVVIEDWGTTEVLAVEPEAELFALEGPDQELVFVGDAGIQGAPGKGVPAGGTTGQYLRKVSSEDYDDEWVSVDGSDATFSLDVSAQTLVTVSHNLGKYPSVTTITSAGDEVEGDVRYLSANQLQVLFAVPFSGKVSCN